MDDKPARLAANHNLVILPANEEIFENFDHQLFQMRYCSGYHAAPINAAPRECDSAIPHFSVPPTAKRLLHQHGVSSEDAEDFDVFALPAKARAAAGEG
jgi:hypothetical protein